MNISKKRFRFDLKDNLWSRGFLALYGLFILGSFVLTLNSVGRGANTGDCSGRNSFYCESAKEGIWNPSGMDVLTALAVAVGTALILFLLWKLFCWIINDSDSLKK